MTIIQRHLFDTAPNLLSLFYLLIFTPSMYDRTIIKMQMQIAGPINDILISRRCSQITFVHYRGQLEYVKQKLSSNAPFKVRSTQLKKHPADSTSGLRLSLSDIRVNTCTRLADTKIARK